MKKVISFFAGVGGIDLAFEQSGFDVIWANEFDKHAAVTYSSNFNNHLLVKDIRQVDLGEIPDADVLVAGFPCQAFSVAGYRKGFNDDRGNLFFELMRIIENKKPPVVFLENVKNLVSHDKGKTFRIINEALQENGYFIKYKILNSSEYGNIPQNRERIYIVAFRSEKEFDKFEFPDKVTLKNSIDDTLDNRNAVESKYYYFPTTCSFYDQLEDEIKDNSVYQWRRKYIRKNKSNLFPTLTANMGMGGHNVPIIKTPSGIRKLTPSECFKVQGFPRSFIIPSQISDAQLYKQAGNSVVVPVLRRIATNIYKAIST
jgi:DNA (cytosine-5)-methyltransferase 1